MKTFEDYVALGLRHACFTYKEFRNSTLYDEAKEAFRAWWGELDSDIKADLQYDAYTAGINQMIGDIETSTSDIGTAYICLLRDVSLKRIAEDYDRTANALRTDAIENAEHKAADLKDR